MVVFMLSQTITTALAIAQVLPAQLDRLHHPIAVVDAQICLFAIMEMEELSNHLQGALADATTALHLKF